MFSKDAITRRATVRNAANEEATDEKADATGVKIDAITGATREIAAITRITIKTGVTTIVAITAASEPITEQA